MTVGNEIHVLSNLLHRAVDNSTAKKEFDQVTASNAKIIGYIQANQDHDVYQRDLEEAFGITRSTASKSVSLMVSKGLIEREPVEGDARLKKLVITESASELCQKMMDNIHDIEAQMTEGFSEEELDRFVGYMHRMQDNLRTML